MWLKVGTIRHRSTWFVRSDPAVGTKLGDDADAINLDITLERYNIAKAFLTKSRRDIPVLGDQAARAVHRWCN
jgi:hypothetical protein